MGNVDLYGKIPNSHEIGTVFSGYKRHTGPRRAGCKDVYIDCLRVLNGGSWYRPRQHPFEIGVQFQTRSNGTQQAPEAHAHIPPLSGFLGISRYGVPYNSIAEYPGNGTGRVPRPPLLRTAVAHPAVQTVVSVQPTDWNLTEKFTTKTASLSHYNLTNSPSTNPSDRQATSNKQASLGKLITASSRTNWFGPRNDTGRQRQDCNSVQVVDAHEHPGVRIELCRKWGFRAPSHLKQSWPCLVLNQRPHALAAQPISHVANVAVPL
eukprot:1680212-Rhodomonas_salina.1